jgi:hypothetical protein
MTGDPDPRDDEPAEEAEAADVRAARGIRAAYAAAHEAVAFARIYRAEPGTTGRRERECLAEVRRLRRLIAALRSPRGAEESPGLRKAAPALSEAAGARRAG